MSLPLIPRFFGRAALFEVMTLRSRGALASVFFGWLDDGGFDISVCDRERRREDTPPLLLRVLSSLNACVASDGCGGVRAGERMADWLSQQNSHSLLSTCVLRGLCGLRAGVYFCCGGPGLGRGTGGDEVDSPSSNITVAFPSSDVVRRTDEEERFRSRGGGKELVGLVRRALLVERTGAEGFSGATEAFNTS
jgi:hypothetical protein